MYKCQFRFDHQSCSYPWLSSGDMEWARMASAGHLKRNQLLFWEVSLFFLETWGSWEDTVWEGGSAAEDREKPLPGAELKLQLLSPFSGSLCKTLSCLTSCCHVSAARRVSSAGRLWDLRRVCTQTALPLSWAQQICTHHTDQETTL